MTLVVRDDLSTRTVLSKSALTTFDICQQKSWFEINDRRPWIPNEKASFGSAVDAAVEQIVIGIRDNAAVDMNVAMAAVDEVLGENAAEVNRDEVERAAERFVIEVVPHRDWTGVATQPRIDVTLLDLGEISTHPDLVYANGDVDDVKTSGRSKNDEPTLELGFYALAVQEFSGEPVNQVGYVTWVRTGHPKWQLLRFPVTDELIRWTRERAGAYIRAKKADEILNRNAEMRRNFSFPGGPAFRSACSDCQYAPSNGGECAMELRSVA